LLAAPDDRPAGSSPSLATVRAVAINLTAGEARILADAIDNHRPIAINYLNRDGNPSSRVIDDIDLSGNSLSAWCRLRDDHRWFNLARITAVEPVTEADR
jgi:predicted DNA-binding transcriptional regulator YafY